MNRPREADCRSHAIWACTSGLRGKATAMFVPMLMWSVVVAASAAGR